MRLHPNLAELYRKKVEHLHELLSNPRTRDEALDILRSLVECVTVRPLDNGFEVELVGEIANMVAIAAKEPRKNGKAAREGAAVLDQYRSSVKVVAGARYQRYLHLTEAWL